MHTYEENIDDPSLLEYEDNPIHHEGQQWVNLLKILSLYYNNDFYMFEYLEVYFIYEIFIY